MIRSMDNMNNMKNMDNKVEISGFTFIKNGLTLGYPIKESIASIAPLCDEVVINVGFDDPQLKKDDGTYDFLTTHFTESKFKFLKSYWDPKLTSQGLILSQQTNIALDACQGKLAIYIQGDEVIHQKDLKAIINSFKMMREDQNIQGVVFNYYHFYGNVDIIKHTRNVYRREVRIIRNNIGLQSHLDAQGFRFTDGAKPRCKRIDANIYHYGWARESQIMSQKIKSMDRLYHGDNYERYEDDSFCYQRIWGLKPFKGTHPEIMSEWISQHRNNIDIMSLKLEMSLKDCNLALSDFIEYLTDHRIGEFKGYRLI